MANKVKIFKNKKIIKTISLIFNYKKKKTFLNHFNTLKLKICNKLLNI